MLLSLVLCSLYFQLKSPPKVAYGLLPSRICQFLLGSLCYKPEKVDSQLLVEKASLLDEREEGLLSLVSSETHFRGRASEEGPQSAACKPDQHPSFISGVSHCCVQ